MKYVITNTKTGEEITRTSLEAAMDALHSLLDSIVPEQTIGLEYTIKVVKAQ